MRFFAGFGVMAAGWTAAAGAVAALIAPWFVEIGGSALTGVLFEEFFEQPFVMSRKTPDITVSASNPAPNRVFSLETERFSWFFFAGSGAVLLPK